MTPPASRPTPSFYGSDAASTVDAALEENAPSADAPLEAPAGQREDCVRLLAERTDASPEDAEARVVQGAYAYDQAANLAQGGKIEGLTFNYATKRVICRTPGGVTETIRRAQTVWAAAYTEAQDDDSWGDGPLGTAASYAEKGASAVGGAIGWVWGEAKGRTTKRLARAAFGKNPAVLMFAAGPSVYRALVTGETSWRQATKDLFETGSGMAGGAAGAAAGAAVGAAALFWIPFVGPPVGGLIGGVTGGLIGAGWGERGGEIVADNFAPDDADALRPLAQDELARLAYAHALVPAEVDRLKTASEALTTDKLLRNWFKLYDRKLDAAGRDPAAAAVREVAREAYAPLLDEIVTARPTVSLPAG
ncbi:hypothetical protein [Alienimonas californiensis]|uniref:Glycine zipper domain-containing protein n=1 Tax=Alienimonas californiensis TaxID=2527989 RepID=A0A517P7X4_9PLAN|nr:hypothetical protein [Alienimonas californiensis]QDT15477.1 hypothetical protein CA12_15620 [Alienimonas californiensis]